MIEQAIEMLNEQQSKVKERSAPWMVAEQLKDICLREPWSAELLAKDLENPQMGIVQAEKKIKAFADGHKTGGFSCVTPLEAEEMLIWLQIFLHRRLEHRHLNHRMFNYKIKILKWVLMLLI